MGQYYMLSRNDQSSTLYEELEFLTFKLFDFVELKFTYWCLSYIVAAQFNSIEHSIY